MKDKEKNWPPKNAKKIGKIIENNLDMQMKISDLKKENKALHKEWNKISLVIANHFGDINVWAREWEKLKAELKKWNDFYDSGLMTEKEALKRIDDVDKVLTSLEGKVKEMIFTHPKGLSNDITNRRLGWNYACKNFLIIIKIIKEGAKR